MLRIQELCSSPYKSDSEAGENKDEVVCIIVAVLNLVDSFVTQRKWLLNFMNREALAELGSLMKYLTLKDWQLLEANDTRS